MAKWRAEAMVRFPELRKLIASSGNIMSLWICLQELYEFARRVPGKEDFTRRILAFADWCVRSPRNSDASRDPSTAVTVSFYEHLDDEHPIMDKLVGAYIADAPANGHGSDPLLAYIDQIEGIPDYRRKRTNG